MPRGGRHFRPSEYGGGRGEMLRGGLTFRPSEYGLGERRDAERRTPLSPFRIRWGERRDAEGWLPFSRLAFTTTRPAAPPNAPRRVPASKKQAGVALVR